MTILEDPPVTDSVLVEDKNIPGHSPKVKDEETDSSEHGENIFHGLNSFIILHYFDQPEDQEQANCNDGYCAHACIEPDQAVSFGRCRFRFDFGQ